MYINNAVRLVDKNNRFLLSIRRSSIGFFARNSTMIKIIKNRSESNGRINKGIDIAKRDQK